MSNDYFKLFVKREGRVVLGKNFSNLWLLTLVLTFTFLAISFSNASLNYLSYKMNDPFVNWVDIEQDHGDEDVEGMLKGLADSTNKIKYHYVDYQMDYATHLNFFGKDDDMVQYLSCRFFQSIEGNSLFKAILGTSNVVNGTSVNSDQLSDDAVGLIVTQDVINKLGYNEAPAFLDFCSNSSGADSLGFDVLIQDKFARTPIPVWAVVKRLPGNMDIISTKYFYAQRENDYSHPFNLNHREYAVSAHYFVPEGISVDDFKDFLKAAYGKECIVRESFIPDIITFKRGTIIGLTGDAGQEIDPFEIKRVNKLVKEEYYDLGVCRVFEYLYSDYKLPQGAYISIQFKDLSKIREFESFLKDNYHVEIEMSQINAKENFNDVSVLANILSWAIVAFSMICIILFIVNLFQSYFQKVKRNLGTFKAFGISDVQLISVYLLIMFTTIVIAIAMALSVSYAVELILPMCGIMKDGSFSYLILSNSKTWYSVVIIVLVSLMTVGIVMKRLLATTPGNLIYDR